MHFKYLMLIVSMALRLTAALPTDIDLVARDNVECYDSGAGWSKDQARGEARSVCEPMKGFYEPNQNVRHCRSGGPFGHIIIEIKRTSDEKAEMIYDSCVGYFTKIIDRCNSGGTDKSRHHEWFVKADPQLGACP